jgi:hypothetical protein
VGVSEAPAVERSSGLREPAVGQAARVHQRPQGRSKWLFAGAHRLSRWESERGGLPVQKNVAGLAHARLTVARLAWKEANKNPPLGERDGYPIGSR